MGDVGVCPLVLRPEMAAVLLVMSRYRRLIGCRRSMKSSLVHLDPLFHSSCYGSVGVLLAATAP